jgi:hypothetical protein
MSLMKFVRAADGAVSWLTIGLKKVVDPQYRWGDSGGCVIAQAASRQAASRRRHRASGFVSTLGFRRTIIEWELPWEADASRSRIHRFSNSSAYG